MWKSFPYSIFKNAPNTKNILVSQNGLPKVTSNEGNIPMPWPF